LEEAKREFEAEGIPLIASHELTRRVMDSQIIASQELVVHENDYDEGCVGRWSLTLHC